MLANLLRAAPLISSAIAVVLAFCLPGRAEQMIALAAAVIGGAGDVAALGLKEYVFEPLYVKRGVVHIPLLGRGPRPLGAKDCGMWCGLNKKESYGLPSGHAAHMWGMAAFVMEISRLQPSGKGEGQTWTGIGLAFIAACISWSRVLLGCHTWSQVLWGGALGCLLGDTAAHSLQKTIWARDTS